MMRLLFSLALLQILASRSIAGPDTVEDVTAEWIRYETLLRERGFRGTASTVYSSETDHGVTKATIKTKYVCKNGNIRYEIVIVADDNAITDSKAFGMNDQYVFELKSKLPGDKVHEGKSLETSWLLNTIELGQNPADPIRKLVQDHSTSLFPLLDFNFIPLKEIPLAKHSRMIPSDQNTLSLAIPDATAKTFKNTVRILDAHLQLDKAAYCILQSGTAKIRMNKTDGVLTIRKQFRVVDGLPVPTSTESIEDYSSASMRLILRRETTYEVTLGVESGTNDFTLAYYGLPEPPGVEWPKPTPLYVWLLLASGILGVVALGSRWLLKRRARNIVPTPPGV